MQKMAQLDRFRFTGIPPFDWKLHPLIFLWTFQKVPNLRGTAQRNWCIRYREPIGEEKQHYRNWVQIWSDPWTSQ